MEHDVEAIILTFIREHCLPQRMQTALGLEDNLFETGTIDSAGLIHLIGYIENRFGIVIPDEDLLPEKFTTVASMADYVRTRLREPAPVEAR
jgi:acyl carrier protein